MSTDRLTDHAAIVSLLRELGVHPQKRLGQNFLVDRSVVQRIQARVEAERPELVLEIGPGLGAITQALLDVSPHVIAIEVDARLAEALRARFQGARNLDVREADILTFDFAQQLDGAKAHVVGSLPYRITSPILKHLVESRASVSTAHLITQWEVAEKIAQSPGKHGSALGVFVHAYAEVSGMKRIRKGAFFPVPDVDSADWEMTFLPQPRFASDESLFFDVVGTLYRNRRKMVRRALRDLLPTEAVPEVLGEAGVEETVRGETLGFDALDRLTRACVPRLRDDHATADG